jgi:hypothetical protein
MFWDGIMKDISKIKKDELIAWNCPWCGINARAWAEKPNIFHFQHCAGCRRGYAWSRMESGQVKTFIAAQWSNRRKRMEVGL